MQLQTTNYPQMSHDVSDKKLYRIHEGKERLTELDADLLVTSDLSSHRCQQVGSTLYRAGASPRQVVVLKYLSSVRFVAGHWLENWKNPIIEIDCQRARGEIARELSRLAETFRGTVLIDVTSVRIPELLILIKAIQNARYRGHEIRLQGAYAIPEDYRFEGAPFYSYHSYDGDIGVEAVPGFEGRSPNMCYDKLLVFFGFEPQMTYAVSEDVRFKELQMINNMPSFFPKYKDISILNNYNFIKAREVLRVENVPADNPFYVCNFLDEKLKSDEEEGLDICIAPLSTKLTALGVGLHALVHDNVRVVYPLTGRIVDSDSDGTRKVISFEIRL